ncbi:MAG: hypothetical protein AABZ06_10655 [Bdellovibrionota bacterium]
MLNFLKICLTGMILLTTGCGLLIGNVKPVDEKSETYGIADLSRDDPDWDKLDQPANSSEDSNPSSSDVSDVVFQSKKTASIISLNSACRPTHGNPQTEDDLRKITNQLFLGVSNITMREEKELTVSSSPALQTTIHGKMNGELMKLRSVVLRKNHCVYDLMYIARPNSFTEKEQSFDKFAASLRLKD